MHRYKLVLSVGCVVMAFSPLSASCGSASCPLDTRSALQTEKGTLRLEYQFEYIDQNEPRIGTSNASVGEIPGDHDEERTINRIHRWIGTWGVTDRLSFDVALPLISRSHRHIDNDTGSPVPEGWDFTGAGDLSVQSRYAFYKPEEIRHPILSGLFGVKFPTGKSTLLNDEGDPAEPGITPGTHSYDFLVGATSLQNFSVPTLQGPYAMLPFFVSVAYKINGKGQDDYKLGNTFTGNIGATYPVLRWLGFISQLNLVVKEPDERGNTDQQTERTGGEYLYYSPGITIRLGSHWDWSSVVQVPMYQRVNQIQLVSSYNVLTSLSYRFKL